MQDERTIINIKRDGVTMGGQEGSRGYLYQGIAAVLEALTSDNWDKIYIEFPTGNDKVDIALSKNDRIVRAIQVKSTQNTFGLTSLKQWITDLYNDYKADEYEVILIGQCTTDTLKFINTCIDYDYLQVGNLCRHTLDLNNVYSSKSEALAAKLNAINPHARVSFETHMLTVNEKGLVTPDLSHFDIIIDTTGNDEVLEIVSTCCTIRKRAIFFSTAIGLGAKRIYMCLAKETSALIDEFSSICEPFYQRDREECAIIELPRDGIGCWHPLFPARADDMWLAACISLKTLESFFADVEHKTLIAIFENKTDGGLFAGYHPVEVKYIDA